MAYSNHTLPELNEKSIENVSDTVFSNRVFFHSSGHVEVVPHDYILEIHTPQTLSEISKATNELTVDDNFKCPRGKLSSIDEDLRHLRKKQVSSLKFKRSLLILTRNVQTEEKPLSEIFDCIDYSGLLDYSNNFVDGLINSAKDLCFSRYGVTVEDPKHPEKILNINWPTRSEFSIDVGKRKLEEYIELTCEVEEEWLYKVSFICAQSDASSDFYLYEVNFSIPTNCYPIAQATVNIYFTYEVCRVKPSYCPVSTSYTLETLSEVFYPGKSTISENMLFRVLKSKLAVYKDIYY